MSGEKLANGLGWFSLGLGLVEVLAPHGLSRALGMEDRAGTVRFFGMRELGAGVGVLAQPRPASWIWARVAGDVLDLAGLASGLGADNPKRGNVLIALGAVAGVTVLDVLCGLQLDRSAK